MAKKKRPKTNVPSPKGSISRTEFERCYLVAKKIMRHFDIEPELLDSFTKRHKHNMFGYPYEAPIVKIEKEKTVPRWYVKEMHKRLFQFMKSNYWGNPENQITYMELAIYGLSFLFSMPYLLDRGWFTGTPQEEIAKRICEKYDRVDFMINEFNRVFIFLGFMTRAFSQVNFRLYGFRYDWDSVKTYDNFPAFKLKILLTSQNCESKMFTYNKIERKAFRLIIAAEGIFEPTWATVPKKSIFPKAKENEKFNIYIQSHVLHRFKERMDVFHPAERNFFIQNTLSFAQKIVSTEKQSFFACMIDYEHPVGYFTFFVQGDDIVVNTFIPAASEITPEGKKLHELLSLSKDDIIYLGMDKASFYLKVDFEQIPILKQAMIDSNLWNTKIALETILSKEELIKNGIIIDMNKTMFVKNFFDKLEQYNIVDYD